MKKLLFWISILGICLSCNPKLIKYEADWIIMKIQYKGLNLLEYTGLRNIRINFEEGGSVPYVYYREFKDINNAYLIKFSFIEKERKDYLIIKGSKFFTDTFEIECLDEGCCTISLKTDDKYIECNYNGELSTFDKRRECPNVMDILKEN